MLVLAILLSSASFAVADSSCSNPAQPMYVSCGLVDQKMCHDPVYRYRLAIDCPNTCSLCQYGGCVDTYFAPYFYGPNNSQIEDIPYCQPQFCTNPALKDFVSAYCRYTCKICTPGDKANYVKKNTTCVNAYSQNALSTCQILVAGGYCSNTQISLAERRNTCGDACGLC